jgi:hypothetical protein
MPWGNNQISEPYEIYHVGLFNMLYDTVNPSVKSWELGAGQLLYYHPYERGTSREARKKLNRSIVVKSLHYYHTTIKYLLNDGGFEELNRSIVVLVVAQRAPLSVEFSNIANRVTNVKPVNLVKKLRGGCLGVELWVTVLVNYIISGVIHSSFYKGQYDMQLVNNLLNFTARGWWA